MIIRPVIAPPPRRTSPPISAPFDFSKIVQAPAPEPRAPAPPAARPSAPPSPFWTHARRCGLLAAAVPTSAPIAAALDAAGQAALETLVDDMMADGVRFYTGEQRAGQGSFTKLTRDELLDQLWRGRADALPKGLFVQSSGMDEWLPLQTLEDLHATDAILRTGDHEDALIRDLHLLRDARFEGERAPFGRSVGAVGAWQALTHAPRPLHTPYGPVRSAADLHALAFFEADGNAEGLDARATALRQMEAEGVTFHQGAQPRTAYEVWLAPDRNLEAGICGVVREPFADERLSPEHERLRTAWRDFRAGGVPADETEILTRALAQRPDVDEAFPRLLGLRTAEAPWGRERETAAERALGDDAWLETRPVAVSEWVDRLRSLPPQDARLLDEADGPSRNLLLLLKSASAAEVARNISAEARTLLPAALALEDALTGPTTGPITRTHTVAAHAVESARLAADARVPDQSLDEAWDILQETHHALARDLPWEARQDVYAFAMREIREGALRGRPARETVQALVAAFVLTGSVERARDHVLRQTSDARIERGRDEVVIGGVRIPRRG